MPVAGPAFRREFRVRGVRRESARLGDEQGKRPRRKRGKNGVNADGSDDYYDYDEFEESWGGWEEYEEGWESCDEDEDFDDDDYDDIYGDDDDAGEYEFECPNCHEVVFIDESVFDEGKEIECPNCGAKLGGFYEEEEDD